MLKFDKWYLPDGEEHLPHWMRQVDQRVDGRLTYQRTKYEMAMAHVKYRRTAVDIGAHIGLWSWQMAHDFDQVICFEPVPAHIECWRENMADMENAVLHEVALGASQRTVSLHAGTPGSCGDTWIARESDEANAAQNVPMMRLDDYDFPTLDFLKIDNEGYEYFGLMGGENIIREHQPVIIVEQKPGMAEKFGLHETQAVKLLEGWGARLVDARQGDYVLAWQ